MPRLVFEHIVHGFPCDPEKTLYTLPKDLRWNVPNEPGQRLVLGGYVTNAASLQDMPEIEQLLGFTPLPSMFFGLLTGLATAFLVEAGKRWFYKRLDGS